MSEYRVDPDGVVAAARALGTAASRGWRPKSPHLAAVGFSYGSTVTAVSLTESSVGSFTAVGSAGIDVHSSLNMNIADGGFSSGQAKADTTATVGQVTGNRLSPSLVGSTTFSTKNAHDADGTVTHGTTHYDTGSTSLKNIAASSMGYPDPFAK